MLRPVETPHDGPAMDAEALLRENAELRARLAEAEDTLRALSRGEVDAIVVGEDIYTLQGAEAAANRFRGDVLAQMEDAVVVVDLQDRLIYLNPAAERQYGLSSSRALGLPRETLFRQEWADAGAEAVALGALEELGFWRGRTVHVTQAGTRLPVESTLSHLYDNNGSVAGLLAVVRDVSQQAAAEAALRESRARLQFTLESAHIGDWEYDAQTDAARRSLRHDQCFGYPAPQADWNLAIFLAHLHPEDRSRVQALMHAAMERVAEVHFQCRVVWPDASEHWIEVHGSALQDEARGLRMLGIVSDITDRKQAEAALQDADRRKDEFIATLAHELRNPLAPIRNALQVMRLSHTPQSHEKAHEIIDRQLRQLVHLVDDLLDVSRISQGKIELRKQRIDIATVLQNAIDTSQPQIEARRHRLELSLPPEAVWVEGDMTRLTQVVANLLNNAAKFTPDGGRITLGAVHAGHQLTITVTDTGVGIAPAMLPQVFDMFTQFNRTLERSQGGLGIGLALVKRLVDLHGGSVEAQSEGEGRGTTVRVRLPAAPAASSGRTDRTRLDAGALAADAAPPRRVLVVDDNLDSAETLAMTLQLMGHETATAHDGEDALRQAEAFRPEIVLLDIGLPRMNGYDVARALRREPWGREMMLVALTGWGQEEDRRRSREAEFDHHLVKPVRFERLEELLASSGDDAAAARRHRDAPAAGAAAATLSARPGAA